VTDTVGQRVQRYMLDGSDKDLRRLLGIAEVMAESAVTALRRSGIGPGGTSSSAAAARSAHRSTWRSPGRSCP
jgi:hypothetical protein